MIDAYSADDLLLLQNSPTRTESLLHSQKQTSGGIGLNVNTNKTVNVCFRPKCAVSSLSGNPQKLVDQFISISTASHRLKMMSPYA